MRGSFLIMVMLASLFLTYMATRKTKMASRSSSSLTHPQSEGPKPSRLEKVPAAVVKEMNEINQRLDAERSEASKE